MAFAVTAALFALVYASRADAVTFSNTTAITGAEGSVAPCGNPSSYTFPSLYPSPITVSGLTGTIADVNVTLNGMSGWNSDFDVLLVGPTGATVVLVSDSGGATISGVTLTLDDDAPASVLPLNGAWPASPITARPTNYAGEGDAWPPTSAPYGATLSVFDGTNPNGTWNLYLTDDCLQDPSSISGGWSLDITMQPLAATFLSASARRTPNGILVRWRTASEIDMLGFNVYRQVGNRRLKVNRHVIAAKGGGAYTFVDRNPPSGTTIRYWIQAVNLDGSRTWYGPARVVRRA